MDSYHADDPAAAAAADDDDGDGGPAVVVAYRYCELSMYFILLTLDMS